MFAFEETKLSKNPLSLNWTWQPKFPDWSDLALCGDTVCGFMPRETAVWFTDGGAKGNKFYFQERWDLEKLGWGWGKQMDKKPGLQLHFRQKKDSSFYPNTLFLCSWILHSLPFSCDLLKALHRYFSVFSGRWMITTRNARNQTVMIKGIFNTPLTSRVSF